MSVVKVSSGGDVRVPEHPTPLGAVCDIPNWVNKRYPDSAIVSLNAYWAMNARYAPRSSD